MTLIIAIILSFIFGYVLHMILAGWAKHPQGVIRYDEEGDYVSDQERQLQNAVVRRRLAVPSENDFSAARREID
jgi:hypothetical protein